MRSKSSERRATTRGKAAAAPSAALRRFALPLGVLAVLAGAMVYLLMADRADEATATAAPVAGPPPVVFEPASFDFGEVPPSTIHTETVHMVNTGAAPLRVLTARSSCGCIQPEVGPAVMQPGAGAPLALRLDSLSQPGVRSYTISVFFSGYETPATLNVTRTTLE